MKTSFVMLSRAVSIIGGVLFSISPVLAQVPQVGPNINMVSGTKWPYGDAFLTKQNEPSHAISSINSQHMLAGANDYRLVFNPLAEPDNPDGGGDAWVYVYKSVDGGANWFAEPISGCKLNIKACNNPDNQPVSPVKGLDFAADPTVRAMPYGMFAYSFIAANRNSAAGGVTAVQRFIDKNDNKKIGDDPFFSDVINILDVGTRGQFKDKPGNIADVPGRPWNAGRTCVIPGYNNGQPVPAFHHYVSYANFTGQGQNEHPQILIARSRDCGKTYEKSVKVSNSLDTNSGSSMAIDPVTGTVYVVWRRFGDPGSGKPDGIYMNKSTDGGNTWGNSPLLITLINPFDQFITGASASPYNPGKQFRTEGFPTIAVSTDSSGTSRVHVGWAQRKTAVDPTTFACPANANCDARIAIVTSSNGGNTWSAPSFIDDWQSDPRFVGADFNPNNFNPGRGHQVQPALTFAGGKLLAAWLDQRFDHSIGVMKCPTQLPYSMLDCTEVRQAAGNLVPGGDPAIVFTPLISDGTPGLARRHTLDVFAAMASVNAAADVNGNPQFQSAPVSQYLFGSPKGAPGTKVSKPVTQLRFSAVNIPIFANNTQPFLGDYIDVAAQTIVATGNPLQPYAFNIGPGKAPFHVTWTDNRDVVPPLNGSWQSYTPISAFVVNADGTVSTTLNSSCTNSSAGQTGTRNQNIYTALVTDAATAYANANSKLLPSASTAKARSFVVSVENFTDFYRSFQLNVVQPPGVTAGFTLAAGVPSTPQVTVNVPPRSLTARTVWVKAATGSERASVTVNVTDSTDGGLTQIVLNPDPNTTLITNAASNTTQDIANLDITNASVKTQDITNQDITNQDLANLDITNNDITNNELTNLDITNLDITNQDITNQDITNQDITNLDLTNQDIANQDIANLDITNNDITNQDIANSALVDSTYTVQNTYLAANPDGGSNTDATVDTKTLLRNTQVPAGYRVQVVLRKIALVPNAVRSCRIGIVQQNVKVASNIVNNTGVNDTGVPGLANHPVIKPAVDDNTLGTFDPTGDPNDPTAGPNAMTLPLSAGERAHLTLRVVGPTLADGTTASDLGQNGNKFVAIGAGGTTTSIPLIVKTFSLLPVVVHKTSTPQPVKSFGGAGSPINWTLVAVEAVNPPSAALPSVTITPANGAATNTATGSTISIVVNKPPAVGTFALTFKVTDQGNPQQSDTQRLILQVTSNNP